MKKRNQKLLSLFLSAMMVVGVVPSTVYAAPEQAEEMRGKYIAGGYGYGHAKQALFEAYLEFFAPMRKRREELLANMDYVHAILKSGGERARAEAVRTMDTVRRRVGLR